MQKLEKSLPQKNQEERSRQNNHTVQNEVNTASIVSKSAIISKSQHALHKLDAASITKALHENAKIIVERIMGKPKEQTGQQYRLLALR